MRKLLVEMQPDRLEDLIAANALYRPGPMDLIPDYNARKHGQQSVPTVHEIVDRYTEETYGVMVYQEQVMQVLHGLGGIPLRQAHRHQGDLEEEIVIDGARATSSPSRGTRRRRGADDRLLTSSEVRGLRFNKSHSTGYAIVGTRPPTWGPTSRPSMAAVLTFESQAKKVEDWAAYLEECRKVLRPCESPEAKRTGVEVRPPDVNHSGEDFSVEFDAGENESADGGHIRFGLQAIKGIAKEAISSIVQARGRWGVRVDP